MGTCQINHCGVNCNRNQLSCAYGPPYSNEIVTERQERSEKQEKLRSNRFKREEEQNPEEMILLSSLMEDVQVKEMTIKSSQKYFHEEESETVLKKSAVVQVDHQEVQSLTVKQEEKNGGSHGQNTALLRHGSSIRSCPRSCLKQKSQSHNDSYQSQKTPEKKSVKFSIPKPQKRKNQYQQKFYK